MEWITVVLLMCSTEPDLRDKSKAVCKQEIQRCIEWIEDQPQTKAAELTRFDIAVWLSTKESRRKEICR